MTAVSELNVDPIVTVPMTVEEQQTVVIGDTHVDHVIEAVSPKVTLERVTGGVRITVEDKFGTKTQTVNDGNGISSVSLNADYTLTINYTDGTSFTTESIRGETGATPAFSIGTVSTLEPNQSATATITGTDEAPVLNLGIPKGVPGQTPDVSGKADKVPSATSGNFAGLDSNGNLTDSGHKHSDYITSHQDITGKADKVQSATSGNFAGLDSNGNLTDSGHKHSDYLTSHQDISGKVDKNQGSAYAGKVLGIGNDGYVTPVPFSGDDFTGATSSSAGTHGYVIAPAAGDQEKYLRGDGTWNIPPGTKPYTFQLDTVTNVSGSYTHTTENECAVASMKPMLLEVSDPDVFQDAIEITFTDGYITLECDSVVGTSDVWVTAMKSLAANEGDPPAMTSTEFDILSNRIGSLSSLTTTAKTNLVSAVNEVDSKISTLEPVRVAGAGRIKITSSLADSAWYTFTSAGYFMVATKGTGSVTAAFLDTYMSEEIPASTYKCIFVFKGMNVQITPYSNLSDAYFIPVVQS